ncbi:MAG: hypothetical protein ABIY55_29675 [Kofleriaceae bacterium]
MADVYFESLFGDLPILIASIETDDGRDIAVQSPARGSMHYLQDRGAKLGKVDCEILFVDVPGTSSFLERFDAFRALVAKGEPQIFSHPLIGSYRARAEGGRHSASSESRQVRYQCAFLPEDEPQPTVPTGAGVAPIAGIESVAVAVSDANRELAAMGLESTAPDDALSFLTTLSESVDVDSQAAIVGVASLTGQINTAIEELDLASHIERWPLYQAMINLISAVQLAGQALTSDSDQLISVRIDRSLPLLAICAEVYGPEVAPELADRITRINRIRTPNRIPAGTTLKLPAPGAT